MEDRDSLLVSAKSSDYVSDVKALIAEARQITYRNVNTVMVQAYWLIGERIVIEEQNGNDRSEYGEHVLKKLSRMLTAEFGNGFSYANLRNMRQFYLTYPDRSFCYTVCSKLSWSHNRLIMYIRMFDDLKKSESDNPTIGILMCAEKDETVVKYSILNDSPQIFASKYLPYLPTEEELKAELEERNRLLRLGEGKEA